MSKWIAVVTDWGFPDLEPERKELEPLGFELRPGQCKTEEEVAALCADADAVLTQWAPITRRAIESMTRCRIIVRYGIGVDNVDLQAAKEAGIPVVNVPDYAVNEVADHAMTLLLTTVRKAARVASRVKNGIWEIAPLRPIMGLTGAVLGLAGFGNIARAVAKRAQAFGMDVIAYDPFVPADAFESLGVRQADWQGLLSGSDVISVHLPLVDGTRNLFNREAFAAMKRGAFLINTSRGGVVHTADLAEALRSEQLGGAALDVLASEPPAADEPLLALETCLITSHCAWYSEASLIRLQDYAAKEISRLFSGGTPKHIVNGMEVIR